MRKLFYFLAVLSVFASCEDVIEVDVPSDTPRLSVDGLVRIQDSSTVTNIQIKVSVTSSFFEPSPPANLDQITITNLDADSSENIMVLIEEEEGSGVYEKLVDNRLLREGRLVLQINYQDENYLARTEFVPTVPITKLEQGTQTLFSGDETELVVAFDDAPDRDDFYIFDFDFDEFLVTEDEFYKGQKFEFSYFYDSDIEAGQEIDISILGADEGFYNYMNQLIVQAGGDQGPFQTPAATVRGNIINVTNIDNDEVFDNVEQPDNFVLGYFAVVQEYKETITIE
ncbi:DUF4249 family protein [Maribacter sp. 2210JD10-5]|uniref:DUF4249 family protein n=1 Tax=Maribacter sp. 2210JD10-5 TaxID=3386272 RepID=UPI0039BD152C